MAYVLGLVVTSVSWLVGLGGSLWFGYDAAERERRDKDAAEKANIVKEAAKNISIGFNSLRNVGQFPDLWICVQDPENSKHFFRICSGTPKGCFVAHNLQDVQSADPRDFLSETKSTCGGLGLGTGIAIGFPIGFAAGLAFASLLWWHQKKILRLLGYIPDEDEDLLVQVVSPEDERSPGLSLAEVPGDREPMTPSTSASEISLSSKKDDYEALRSEDTKDPPPKRENNFKYIKAPPVKAKKCHEQIWAKVHENNENIKDKVMDDGPIIVTCLMSSREEVDIAKAMKEAGVSDIDPKKMILMRILPNSNQPSLPSDKYLLDITFLVDMFKLTLDDCTHNDESVEKFINCVQNYIPLNSS